MKHLLLKSALTCIAAFSVNAIDAQTVVKQIYYTDFTDWTVASEPTSKSISTRFNGDNITISTTGDMIVAPTATVSSKTGYIGIDAANKNGSIQTTTIPSVNQIAYSVAVGRGGGNGMKLEVKGDGDSDWITLNEEKVSATTDFRIDVNRKNVQIRFTNITATKSVYLTSLQLTADVDANKVPTLTSFKINGNQYDASAFTEQNDGTMAYSLEIPKSATMISEANPITDVKASVGSLKGITYNGDATKSTAQMTLTGGTDDVVYNLSVSQYPDFTVTYSDINGTVLGTQSVEKNSAIGSFPALAIPAGGKMRGYFAKEIYVTKEGQKFDYYRKVTTDEIVTGNMTLYAITSVEESTADSRHEYVFCDHINAVSNPYFYMEDHEGIEVVSGEATYHDATHGLVIKPGTILKVSHAKSAQIALYLCSNTPSASTISVAGQTISARAKADNKPTIIIVNGNEESSDITFNGECYLHALTVTNDINNKVVKADGYIQVAAGDADAYLAAIEAVNSNDDVKQIYLPNGTYDLGEKVLTSIYADNVSIIGESMEGTVIKNAPKTIKEGINLTATLRNYSKSLYLQDLTLQNNLDYYKAGSAGRGICLQDKGENTICKNVRMLSYQDTYYSNKASKFYWEDCEIHGTVDYICGDGDVIYNRVKFVNENRNATTTPNGETTVAAPYTTTEWGYVLLDCSIDCKSATFTLGRAWDGSPRITYINTTILNPSALLATRFNASGMNVAAKGFYEYNTKDVEGNVISPVSNVVNFTHPSGNNKYETILSDQDAAKYTIANIFKDWKADQIAAQVKDIKSGTVFLANGTITSVCPTSGKVRVANGRGGFGPEIDVTNTRIESINNRAGNVNVCDNTYNLAGQRINGNAKGIQIKNGKKTLKN